VLSFYLLAYAGRRYLPNKERRKTKRFKEGAVIAEGRGGGGGAKKDDSTNN
jgi:hypothetical protein